MSVFPYTNLPHGPKLLSGYFGPWAMESRSFGLLKSTVEKMNVSDHLARRANVEEGGGSHRRATLTTDGVLIAEMRGTMMKFESSMDESVSTAAMRRTVRQAYNDERVRGMLLVTDSPGGTVSGTESLASDLRAFAKKKPLHGYGEDTVASACYWAMSQCDFISTHETADIGSLGVIAVVYDWSGAFEAEGIKVHAFTTEGGYKGTGVPGTELTEAQQAYIQSLIDGNGQSFKQAIAYRNRPERSGRKFDMDKVFVGRCWLGTEAMELGLVDAIESFDQAYARLVDRLGNRRTTVAATKATKQATLNTETHMGKKNSQKSDEQRRYENGLVMPTGAEAATDDPEDTGADGESTETGDNATPAGGEKAKEPAATGPSATESIASPGAATKSEGTRSPLREACPGASADFLLAHLESGSTIEAAKSAYITEQNKRIALLEAERKSLEAKVAELEAKVSDADAEASDARKTLQKAVGTKPVETRVGSARPAGKLSSKQVSEIAKENWKNDVDGCRTSGRYANDLVYIGEMLTAHDEARRSRD